jgi:hypothetical protein
MSFPPRLPGLMAFAAVLAALAASLPAGAAISEGTKPTNAVVAEERRQLQFHDAELSYQEKLEVGKRRYEQKQQIRAKVIQAMSAQLQARQQEVVIEPVEVAGENSIPDSGTFPIGALLTVSLVGLGYFLVRLNRPAGALPPPPEESGRKGSGAGQKRYRITALKPVAVWAKVEISPTERTLVGRMAPSASEKRAWIQLKAGEVRDRVCMVAGMHPDSAPHRRRVHWKDAGSDIVPLGTWSDEELPKNFFETFILEASD